MEFDSATSIYRSSNDIFIKLLDCTENENFYPIWNKIYKKRIIDKYDLRFDEKLYCGEDFKFNLDYLQHCQQMSTVSDAMYNYRIIDSSLSKKFEINTIAGSLFSIINRIH